MDEANEARNLVKLQNIKLMNRNPFYSYSITMKNLKSKLKKHVIHHYNKRIKYFRINLPKETKDPYAENYNTMMTEVTDDTNI